jgi:hypothetical protein
MLAWGSAGVLQPHTTTCLPLRSFLSLRPAYLVHRKRRVLDGTPGVRAKNVIPPIQSSENQIICGRNS